MCTITTGSFWSADHTRGAAKMTAGADQQALIVCNDQGKIAGITGVLSTSLETPLIGQILGRGPVSGSRVCHACVHACVTFAGIATCLQPPRGGTLAAHTLTAARSCTRHTDVPSHDDLITDPSYPTPSSPFAALGHVRGQP